MSATTAGQTETSPPDSPPATPDQPVGGAERLVSLDLIRGIAVVGILFANITGFGHPMLAYYWPGALPGGGNEADQWVWLFQFVMVDGKFRGLFTILFGAGMVLFIDRLRARGGSQWLQARRLFWLALFGIAHFVLLWRGDILFLYAIAGFAGLLFLNWEANAQLRVGLIWFVIGALGFSAMLGMQAAAENIPAMQSQAPEAWSQLQRGWDGAMHRAGEETRLMQHGGYGEIVAYRLGEQADGVRDDITFALLETIPLMLIGMGLYRSGFFEGRLDATRMRRWGWVGLIGGALLSLSLGWWAMAWGFPPFLTQFLFNGPAQLPRLAMVLGAAALLTLWASRLSRGWLGSRFVAAGRMAFSNYVGTSLIMMAIFQGWGGGFYGELNRLALLPAVLLGSVLMLAWSKPWLRRFRYGPLEWLWRCLTYGRLFPIRR